MSFASIFRFRSRSATKNLILIPGLALIAGCSASQSDPETLRFADGAVDVEVRFFGEIGDSELFGPDESLLDQVLPRDADGKPRGRPIAPRPGWLHFEYRINGVMRELLVAKQPLMNYISWEDIARAGAAMGDDSAVRSDDGSYLQNARITDIDGNDYRIRLPTCGHSTLGNLSEWNLLIGAVHAGDIDFTGDRYGWVSRKYGDKDLRVGYKGTLSWCQDSWWDNRVVRGYYYVSRFNAADPFVRTNRVAWRPVLERVRIDGESVPVGALDSSDAPAVSWSPSGRVGFAGVVLNSTLFGQEGGIDQRVAVEGGHYLEDGRPDWLRFVYHGKTLLVAAKPVKHSVSWDAIARAGAVAGDGSGIRVGRRTFPQETEIKDINGNLYRVRLLSCGRSTLDLNSEWNALLGGVHKGDGDFLAYPQGVYGWLSPPFEDFDFNIGVGPGSASWCQETVNVNGEIHGVNRGFLTISRFHATKTDFTGSGFGWRPVLEYVP
jgi:hypothetical protein